MSTLKVNKLRDTSGSTDAITLDPNGGAVLAGVTTISTARITTGITTSIQVGGGVTISESGIEASGIGITCASINGAQIGGRRNIIINGAMEVSQRGTSFSEVANNDYTLDRFGLIHPYSDHFDVSQSTDSPDGFSKSYKLDINTVDSSIGSGQYVVIRHKIEAQNLQQLAFGTSDAKPITLSFYVRSNTTGTYGVAFQNAAQNRSLIKEYTINSADTWERKTITISPDPTALFSIEEITT